MAKPFEIYFFGLICFVHDEMGINYAEIIKEHHNSFVYAPELQSERLIKGRLSTSLSSGAVDFGLDIPRLTDHASYDNSSATVAHKHPGPQAYTFILPRGEIVTADFYSKKGQFDNGVVRNIPRINTLLVNNPTETIDLLENDKLIVTVKKDSWILIANVGADHDCKMAPSHFRMYRDVLEHFDRLDGLCYSTIDKDKQEDNRPQHTSNVIDVIKNLPVPHSNQLAMVIFNQVDCSSSQWP